MKPTNILSVIAAVAIAISASAAKYEGMNLHVYNFSDGAFATNVSANGRYAVYSGYRPDNSLYDALGKMIDLQSGDTYDLKLDADATSWGALCVADDGRVAGVYGDKLHVATPSWWEKERGWTALPYPAGDWEGGMVYSMTPDGSLIAGKVYRLAMMEEKAVLWQWAGDGYVVKETPGVPYKNLRGEDEKQTRFNSVSADGRYVTGQVSFSYEHGYQFVYDTLTEEWFYPGHKPDGSRIFEDLNMWGAGFTPYGTYMYGRASGKHPDTGKHFSGIYRMDMKTGNYEFEEAEELSESMVTAMADDGVPYACAPGGNPIRTWYVLADGYWISFEQILANCFGTNIEAATGYEDVRSGTVMGLSSDGRVMASLIYFPSAESYVVEFDEKPVELAKRVDLLKSYSVTPHEGAAFASLGEMQIDFERNVDWLGNETSVRLEDEEGNVVANSLRCTTRANDPSILEINFRHPKLEKGKKYRVVIDEGLIRLAGNDQRKNSRMEICYEGRDDRAVELIEAFPADGAQLAQFNMSTSPVVLSFDCEVKVAPGASAFFYLLGSEGEEVEIKSFVQLLAIDHRVAAYPNVDQLLYKGNRYRIELAEGALTDLTGNGPSERIVLDYEGCYVRDFNGDDKSLFRCDFNDGQWIGQFMWYEGDHNEPSAAMKNWNFVDGDNYPWWWVRDDEQSSDYALCSHSMYVPAGQSDDWAIIPQLLIPDDKCVLAFKAQSYRKNKADRITVRLLATDDVYNYPTDEFIARFKSEGVAIADELLTPGRNEELLAGDWAEKAVSLADYAGKMVYIAFVNENYDQSAIFIDDVSISRNMDFMVSTDVPLRVVDTPEVAVTGRVRYDLTGVIEALSMELRAGDGSTIETLELAGPFKYGSTVDFAFETPLRLAAGKTTPYGIAVKAGNAETVVMRTIDNLLYRPVQRVLIEEGTGQTCPNCPLGHLMIERLTEAYPDAIIPVAIHTYTGDNMASGLNDYASWLGITYYPAALINRRGPYLPMSSDGMQELRFSDPDTPLWWDIVGEEFNAVTIAQIDVTEVPRYTSDSQIHVKASVGYALDVDHADHRLFAIVTEDGVAGVQWNNFGEISSPLLGPWGKGGEWSASAVPFDFDHVARGIEGMTYNGTPGLLPTELVAGETYDVELTLTMPRYVANADNTHVVLVLIDGLTGSVINSCTARPVMSTTVEGLELQEVESIYYDLQGMRVEKPGNGIYVKRTVYADGSVVTSKVVIKGR